MVYSIGRKHVPMTINHKSVESKESILVEVVLDVFDGISHGGNLLSLVIGNGYLEYTLELHDQLHGVQRIGAKVVLETGLELDLALVYAKFVNNNIPDLFLDF